MLDGQIFTVYLVTTTRYVPTYGARQCIVGYNEVETQEPICGWVEVQEGWTATMIQIPNMVRKQLHVGLEWRGAAERLPGRLAIIPPRSGLSGLVSRPQSDDPYPPPEEPDLGQRALLALAGAWNWYDRNINRFIYDYVDTWEGIASNASITARHYVGDFMDAVTSPRSEARGTIVQSGDQLTLVDLFPFLFNGGRWNPLNYDTLGLGTPLRIKLGGGLDVAISAYIDWKSIRDFNFSEFDGIGVFVDYEVTAGLSEMTALG